MRRLIFSKANHQLESRIQEIWQSGSEGGAKPTFVPTPIATPKSRPVGYGVIRAGVRTDSMIVPYGTVLSRDAFPGTSCQATIGVVPTGRACRHFATASLQELAFGHKCVNGSSRDSYNSLEFNVLWRQFLERTFSILVNLVVTTVHSPGLLCPAGCETGAQPRAA